MMIDNQEITYRINILWGSFGVGGRWHPNDKLTMSEDEQYKSNVLINPDLMGRYEGIFTP